jgi:hypothetical protein
MRKLLILLTACALVVAFTVPAMAFDQFSIKGYWSLRGSQIKNDDATATKDAAVYGYYDQDLKFWLQFNGAEKTFVRSEITWYDEEWGTAQNMASDENIAVERVYFTHIFGTGTKLDLGLMDAGVWATGFGDDEYGANRIKVTQPLPGGHTLVALTQKDTDTGYANQTTKDADKDDDDQYAVAAIIKAGPINIKPLVQLVDRSSLVADGGSKGAEATVIAIGVDGKFGMIGFEAEYVSQDWDYDPSLGLTDYDVAGWYGNVWANLGPAQVGFIYATGDYDKQSGNSFDFDDDFDLTLYLSDWIGFGGGDGITGCDAYQVYGSYKFSDKLSANASYTMVDSNQEAGTYKDAEANEIDFGASYKLTKVLTYSVAAGFASIDYTPAKDPEDGYRVYHKLKMSF